MTDTFSKHIFDATKSIVANLDKDDIFGFALCPDSELTTFYHVFCTHDWVKNRQSDYPEIGEIPTEWTMSGDGNAYQKAEEIWEPLVRGAYLDENFSQESIASRFNLLVAGLQACRDQDLFAPKTLVMVCITDPSEPHEFLLMMKSTDALNEKSVADIYAKTHDYEAYR